MNSQTENLRHRDGEDVNASSTGEIPADLIERLRKKADAEEDNYLHGSGTNIFFPLLDEAADTLAANVKALAEIRAENERLRGALKSAGSVLDEMVKHGFIVSDPADNTYGTYFVGSGIFEQIREAVASRSLLDGEVGG